MNKEQRHIFDDVTKKQKLEEPIHLFITGGAGTGKNLTLMLLFIQALLHFYDRHPDSDHLKKKPCLWRIQEKQHTM
jgi:hypothetical protein